MDLSLCIERLDVCHILHREFLYVGFFNPDLGNNG